MASPQFVGGSVNSLTVGWRRCEYHMPMAAAAAPAAAMLAMVMLSRCSPPSREVLPAK